ncbi:FdhF/YdeP family oxidoreductase [Pigmentiphaga litoralis]|uniref:FdhF/YdeP family oxidoreductase n=1 Tax=Pigmentiphaga litoralis TaxID=516702 RepID=UPI003B434E46
MKTQKIEFYRHPAGGWGALKSVASQLLGHGIPAKGAKTMLSANQPDGFDCPGCAWPDRDHASTFEFCENGVKAVAAEATSRRATADFFRTHTVSTLLKESDFFLEDQGRLTEPLAYDAGTDTYVPISWDDAFATIGRHLRALPDPDQAIFYTSGRTSNEAAFLYQLFVREYGTNNFPDCSNMCHEPSGTGLRSSIGVGKGTVTLDDFERADTIFIFGQNPGTNHPRMLGELRAAAKRGARIVSFNPLRERGLERFANPQSPMAMLGLGSNFISTDYHQLRIGGDLAAIKGIIKHVIEADDAAVAAGQPRVLDTAFIAEHTHGFDIFVADIRAESWEAIEAESGLPEAQLRATGETYLAAKAVIACWGMGITQHKHSVATIQMITNLLLLRGHIGRPGAGACPVRGHSNVQGDRTMGIYEQPSQAFLDRLDAVFGIQTPRTAGFDTIAAIQAMRDGKASVFIGMGGNFASATPDTAVTEAALRRCALTVHVSTKLNRSHLVHGKDALILPCLGRTEIDLQAGGAQGVTVEDSMSMVHLSSGINPPASDHLLSEPAIVARMAKATLPDSRIDWLGLVEDYDRIRGLIEQVFDDFAGFNDKLRHPGGFRLRNTASERVWNTPTGKANFFAQPIPRDLPIHQARQHTDDLVFNLATVRSHDQYNTTIYGMNDRYRGVYGHRRVVFIHGDDIRALGMKAGDWVDLTSIDTEGRKRRADRFLLVEYAIPRGCIASYYPETNGLVPLSSFADQARTPTSKSIPVMLTPHHAHARSDSTSTTDANTLA